MSILESIIPEGAVYLRLPQVQRIFGGISKSKIYGDIRRGTFPPPLKLGPRISVWSTDTIRAYIADLEGDVS